MGLNCQWCVNSLWEYKICVFWVNGSLALDCTACMPQQIEHKLPIKFRRKEEKYHTFHG